MGKISMVVISYLFCMAIQKNPDLVKEEDGTSRDTMVWHFPHGVALESTIREGDFKLIRNYDHVENPATPELELFQLYDTEKRRRQSGSISRRRKISPKHFRRKRRN